jgi:hypothetical protein
MQLFQLFNYSTIQASGPFDHMSSMISISYASAQATRRRLWAALRICRIVHSFKQAFKQVEPVAANRIARVEITLDTRGRGGSRGMLNVHFITYNMLTCYHESQVSQHINIFTVSTLLTWPDIP